MQQLSYGSVQPCMLVSERELGIKLLKMMFSGENDNDCGEQVHRVGEPDRLGFIPSSYATGPDES